MDTSVLHSESELSEHFTWDEACISTHREIDNTIPVTLKNTIKFTASRMERVRALLQEAITVNSWYRCYELNAAVGGSKTSQHVLGEAIDFISPKYGKPIAVVRKIAAYWDLIKFDQLILEYTWIHISFVGSVPGINPRGEVLTLLKNKHYASGITDLYGKPI
jgi:hypothetical protein